MTKGRPVVVMQLPERLKLGEVQEFLREVEPLLKVDCPRLVFDFSQVHQIDSAGVDMLLRCLQEVMKRDGDLKLASVTAESAVILELTRIDRLFEIFESVSDAIESFQGRQVQSLQSQYPWHASPVNGIADLKMTG